MKNTLKIVLIFISINFLLHTTTLAYTRSKLPLTPQEQKWLGQNSKRTFVLGIDPYAGMEYFRYDNKDNGYIIPLIKLLKEDLGINIQLETSKSWGDVFSGLQTGSVDILFGANKTPERDKIMSFTRPVYSNPYAIIARVDSNINTIGDIDKKRVGFIKDDFVATAIPELYKHIKYTASYYPSQTEAITALQYGDLDAFITSGGPIVYDYIYKFPELKYAFKLNSITSDMTLSTRKSDEMLAQILDKEINAIGIEKMEQIINKGEMAYYIKIMNLTPLEKKWLNTVGKAVVGVTNDYLPFDFMDNNIYEGISGEIIKEISNKTGIKFTPVVGDFDTLCTKLLSGNIDILNIAKTEERENHILYPQPYSKERDIIIGKKSNSDVRDIFGLEGKKVAVIKGFWHDELLNKNLTNVHIIETNSIQESLKLVYEGKADYLIENPTVARYYIEELDYFDLVQRGITSTDSYLYYGITKKSPELCSIINKVLPLLDIEELFRKGYEQVPHSSKTNNNGQLILIISFLAVIIILTVIWVIKLINALVKEKTESELLRQKEQLLYTDTLTELYNRNYFTNKIKPIINEFAFPQTIIIGDMNNLKIVNDKYGHYVGDELLKHFAGILKATCPNHNLIFRIGGDEFYIILPDTGQLKAEEIICSIRNKTADSYFTIDNTIKLNASAALGFSIRYTEDMLIEETLKEADLSMYEDKKYKPVN